MNRTEVYDIILVEDKKSDAEMIIRALNKSGAPCTILHLSDGRQALDFFHCEGEFSERKSSELPRLVLLDLKMPKVSGIEVLNNLKQNDDTKMVPIIVFTSSKELTDIRACYLAGANSYISKPVEYKTLCEVITDLKKYWLTINQKQH